MNKIEFIKGLKQLGIRDNQYSLEGNISNVASMVLYNNHDCWEIINIDDKGNQIKGKSFKRIEEAYDYIYQYFRNVVELYNDKTLELKSLLKDDNEDDKIIYL